MPTLVLERHEIRELLPMGECMDAVEEAFRMHARGDVVLPLRNLIWQPDGTGLLGVMPAYLGGDVDAPGVKVVTVFPGNHGTELDAHQGAVLLFEGRRGQLLAILDGSEVTAIRTAAASGVATRLLAREDASELLMIGAGVQSSTHIEAMACARSLRRVRVWSRNVDKARAFVAAEAGRHGPPIEVAEDLASAVGEAHIVCVVTSAKTPVLEGRWLQPGTHVNAVGACMPTVREIDTEAVGRASLFCDSRESLLAEAGDFLIPKKEGALGDDHIVGEIGEVLEGTVDGRRSRDEITLFESLGLGIEDVAAAHHVYVKARERGVGTAVDLGGLRSGAD